MYLEIENTVRSKNLIVYVYPYQVELVGQVDKRFVSLE